jgi:Fe-S cluster assembly ATP-binding protein
MLKISDLNVSIEDKKILNDLTLTLEAGKVNVLMGPNGSGKSTLAQSLMGNPNYEVNSGKVDFDGKDLLEMEPDERALAGVFLSFQYPSEIPGVNISNYLRMIYNKKNGENLSPVRFRKKIAPHLELLNIKEEFLTRYLNDGFSGGEKKRMEMLQMLVMQPKLAILDETDSGLDIDALKIVSEAVNHLTKEQNMTVLLITHYTRILKYIEPDKVFIMRKGKIVQEGSKDLAHELEEKGYEPFSK